MMMLMSCAAADRDNVMRTRLVEFDMKLAKTIRSRDTSALIDMFMLSQRINNIDTLKAMRVRIAASPNDVRASLVDHGSYYRRIMSDKEYSIASFLHEGRAPEVTYDVFQSGNMTAASIRYGKADTPMYGVEFIVLYQNGGWHLLTINFGDADA